MRNWRFDALMGLAAFGVLWAGVSTTQAAPNANAPAGDQAVYLLFRVPSDADVWVEGTPTTMRGSVRAFTSPPIRAGQDYLYKLRVRGQRNGQPFDETREISVRAGDAVQIDYSGSTSRYTIVPGGGNAERAFYYTPESEPDYRAPRVPAYYRVTPRNLSYYGATPGWGTADTTGP